MWYCTPAVSKLGARRTRAAGSQLRLQPGLCFQKNKGGRGHDQNSKFFTEEIKEVHLFPKTKNAEGSELDPFFFSDSRFETTTYNCFPEHTWNIPECRLRVIFPCSQLLVLMWDALIPNPAFGNNRMWPSLSSQRPVTAEVAGPFSLVIIQSFNPS